MSRVSHINAFAIQETTNVFRSETVAYSPNLFKPFVLQVFYTNFHDWIYILNGVSAPPFHEIKPLRTIQLESIASEGVQHYGIVSIGCILVYKELAVLPNANDIGKDKDGRILMNIFALGFGDVCIVTINFDGRARDFAPIIKL